MNSDIIISEKIVHNMERNKGYLLISNRYENTTPWWGRNPLAKNIEQVGDIKIVGIPTAKALIGRIRWVMAAILSSKCGSNREVIEEVIGKLLGSTSSASMYRLLVRLVRVSEHSIDRRVIRSNAIRFLSNRGSLAYSPLSPGALELSVIVYRNFRKREIRGGNLDSFLLKSVELALRIYGFGYRANRGFGRFMPLGREGGDIDAWSMIEDLERINVPLPERCVVSRGRWPISPIRTIERMQEELGGQDPGRDDLTINLEWGCYYDMVLRSISEAVLWSNLRRSLRNLPIRVESSERLVLGAPRGSIQSRVGRRQSEIVVAPICYRSRYSYFCSKIYVLPHYGEDLTQAVFRGNSRRHLEVLAALSKGLVKTIKSQLKSEKCQVA